MTRLRAALRRRVGGDRGASMAELVVTMMVSVLLLSSVSALVIAGVRNADSANQRNTAVGQMRVATDRMTRYVRTAASYNSTSAAFLVAEPERIAFYARIDTLDLTAANAGTQTQAPSVIWLWTRAATGGSRELCQQVYRGTAAGDTVTFPTGAQSATATRTCQVVARGLSSTAAHPTFTYLQSVDTTYRADGSSVSSIPVDGTGAVVAANFDLIDSVEFWLTSSARIRNAAKAPSTVARVTLLNLNREGS